VENKFADTAAFAV